MGWLDFMRPRSTPAPAPAGPVLAHAGGVTFNGLDDPALLDYIRGGGGGPSSLVNTAVFRAVDLISNAIASLPFRPMRRDASGMMIEAADHPLFEVLNGQANAWQSSFEFKRWMQMRVLVDGEAFARIVRTGARVVALLPLTDVSFRLTPLGEPVFEGPTGQIPATDIFHLRDHYWQPDGSLSRVQQATRAIGLSQAAETAALSMFRGGMSPGGFIKHPSRLSPEARAHLRQSMEAMHGGAENAGRWLLIEEGMAAEPFTTNARDSQQIERSRHQVDEIARVFGVPRPLMGVDDTSWGTGIEQLAILFVRFTLAPWFAAWEQRARMSLLTRAERLALTLDFDERELLRGTLKDQAEFFAKALGGPGSKGWMVANEVRELSGLGRRPDGDGLATFTERTNDVAA